MRESTFCSLGVAVIIAAFLAFPPLAAAGNAIDYGGYRPHYQGFGVNTRAGRGGTVYKVTNLNDSGSGSLRAAVSATGPRFVIFEISGTINLSSQLVITNPFLTIAGQTAPSPGVTIRGRGVAIDTHDVVLQHLRIRVGNISGTPIALALRDDATNVVIDHVSVSWSVWTTLTVGANQAGHPTGDVTIIDSLIYEALGCSGVNEAPGYACNPDTYFNGSGWSNSRGVLIGDGWGHAAARMSLIRTINANVNDRHPEIGGNSRSMVINNLIYNPSQTPFGAISYHDGYHVGNLQSVVVGNLLIPGPTTPGNNGYVPPEYPEEGYFRMVRLHPSVTADSRIYLEGNYYAKDCGGMACLASPAAQWMMAVDTKWDWEGVNVRATTPPLSLANLPISSAMAHTDVEAFLKANSGARPLDRDVADARIIAEITARTGSVPNRTSDKAGPGTASDGFPILAVNQRTLVVPTNPHAAVDTVGRTRIEEWLETYARALEPAQSKMGEALVAPANMRFVY